MCARQGKHSIAKDTEIIGCYLDLLFQKENTLQKTFLKIHTKKDIPNQNRCVYLIT